MTDGEPNTELSALVRQAVLDALASAAPLQAPPAVTPLTVQQTPILGLKMPQYTDAADILVLNDNMVTLDGSITATQAVTLTNKTLTAPILNNPTVNGWGNANHTHLDPASAGTLDGAAIVAGDIGDGLVVRETYVDDRIALAFSGGGTDLVNPDLIDPVVRDTLWWGPAPTGTPDVSLKRLAAQSLALFGDISLTRIGAGWVNWSGAVAPALGLRSTKAGASTGPKLLSTGDNLSLGWNVRTNPAGDVWMREDITKRSALLVQSPTDALVLYGTEAGPTPSLPDDPIAWKRFLVVDYLGNLGVGMAPPSFAAPYAAAYAGILGAYGRPDAAAGGLRMNSYYDGATNRAIVAGAGLDISMSSGEFHLYMAPSVAAATTQAMVDRFSVTNAGHFTLVAGPNEQVLDIQQQATNLITTPSIMIRRGSPTTQHQTIRFQNGASAGDMEIGRHANDDSFFISAFNGVNVLDRVKVQFDGTMVLGSGANGSGAIVFNAAGVPEQRYMISTAYQSDLTIQDIIRNGPVVLRIARATNTLTLSPNTGQAAIDFQVSPSALITSAGSIVLRCTANMHVNPTGTIFGPETDGTCNLGYSNVRWAQIWSSIPSISTSHVSMKHDFAPLDPASCVEAVLGTDWLSFAYNDPPMAPFIPSAPPAALADEETDDAEAKAEKQEAREALEAKQRAEAEEAYQQMLAETADSRKQNGYVLGSDEYATADLFGTRDRMNASTHADLAVVACALQSALRDIADLKAQLAGAA